MAEDTYDSLKARISGNLSTKRKELAKSVGKISRDFHDLGLEAAVWCPKRIHSANIGGLHAESYIGYSRIEGKWGLNIRTIERDHETRAFVNQRVYALEASGNVEVIVAALKEVPELWKQIAGIVDQEIGILEKLGPP
jgi:hypothetical protein